jgi:hypothetical protein
MPYDEPFHIIERDTGIAFERLNAWASNQPLGRCTVTLTPMPPRKLGPVTALPRTLLKIEGPAEETARLYRSFELHFLSAGG